MGFMQSPTSVGEDTARPLRARFRNGLSPVVGEPELLASFKTSQKPKNCKDTVVWVAQAPPNTTTTEIPGARTSRPSMSAKHEKALTSKAV